MKEIRLKSLFLMLLISVAGWAKVAVNPTDFTGYDYTSKANIWKAIDETQAYTPSFYYAPNWSQLDNPKMTQQGSVYTLELPVATYAQWQAQFAINCNSLELSAATNYDFSCVVKSNVDISKVTVKLTSKTDDNYYLFSQTFGVKGGDTNVLYLTDLPGIDAECKMVLDFGGNEANCVVSVEDMTLKDHATDDGTVLPSEEEVSNVQGYRYDYKTNLWRDIDAKKDYKTTFWYAPGWNQIADPVWSQEGNVWTFTLPKATTDQWQAQCFIIPTSLVLTNEKHYDFSCIINSSTDNGHVTVKLTDKNSDSNYLFTEVVSVVAGKDYLLKLTDLAGINGDCKLVLDFGGNGDNCVAKVSEIVLKDHSESDGSDFNGFSFENDANLWKPIHQNKEYTNRYYYAPGWGQIADPELTVTETGYSYYLPQATSDQWQAQCFFTPTSLQLSSKISYDFSCVLSTTKDISNVTVKLTSKTDAGYFLFTETFSMSAGETKVFYKTDMPGIDADCEFVFDFGGNAAECTVSIDRVTLKDHSVNDGTVIPGQEDPEDALLRQAWESYENKCAQILETINNNEYDCDERDLLYSYLTDEENPGELFKNGSYKYITEAHALDKDALLAEIDWLDGLYKAMINNTLNEGTDVTYFLTNSDMSQSGFKGWDMTITKRGGSSNANSGVGMDFWTCAESWNTAFDCKQTVENMPNGLYEIGVYAYYRPGAVDAYNTDAVIPCQLYMNDFYTTVKNITDDALPEADAVDGENCRLTANDGIQTWSVDLLTPLGYLPNGEWSSSYAFASGRYYQKVYGMVLDGKMTVGIRSTGEPWYEDGVAYWSKFKIIYMGKNIDALDGVLASYEQRAQKIAEQEGVYFYNVYKEELQKAIEAGKSATTADEKYANVIAINEAFNKIDNSTAVYTDLANANEAMMSWLYESSEVTKEQKDEYTQLYNTVWDNVMAGIYTDEEASEMADKLRGLINGTGIKAVAADANVVNVYNMSGQKVANSEGTLNPGLYIIQANGKTIKKVIR